MPTHLMRLARSAVLNPITIRVSTRASAPSLPPTIQHNIEVLPKDGKLVCLVPPAYCIVCYKALI